MTTRTVHDLAAFYGNTAIDAAGFVAAWYGGALFGRFVLWTGGRMLPYLRYFFGYVGEGANTVGGMITIGLLHMGTRGGRFLEAGGRAILSLIWLYPRLQGLLGFGFGFVEGELGDIGVPELPAPLPLPALEIGRQAGRLTEEYFDWRERWYCR